MTCATNKGGEKWFCLVLIVIVVILLDILILIIYDVYITSIYQTTSPVQTSCVEVRLYWAGDN